MQFYHYIHIRLNIYTLAILEYWFIFQNMILYPYIKIPATKSNMHRMYISNTEKNPDI